MNVRTSKNVWEDVYCGSFKKRLRKQNTKVLKSGIKQSSGRSKDLNSATMLQAIVTNMVCSTRRVSGEFGISESSVVCHLHHPWKKKISNSRIMLHVNKILQNIWLDLVWCIIEMTLFTFSLISWGCWINRLDICRGVRHPPPTSVIDMTLKNLIVTLQ